MFINLYLNRFLGEMVPILPLIGLLLHDRDFSLSLISLFLLYVSVTVLLLEIPFGMLADKTNPRLVLILSRLAKLISFVLLLFSFNQLLLFFTAVFLGIASALDSGAMQSYTYKLTCSKKDEDSFHRVYSKTFTSSLMGLLLAGVLASQIVMLGFEQLQYIGIFALALCFISALFLPKVKSSDGETVKSEDKFHLSSLFKLNITIVIILCIGIFAGGVKGSLDEYTALLLADKGLVYGTVGYILLGLEIFRALGASTSSRFKIGTLGQISVLSAVGLLFIAVYHGNYWVATGSLLIVLFLDSILWVNNDVLIQKNASDNNRSTIASLKNFGTEVVAGIVFASVWLFGSDWDIGQLYLYGGTVLLTVSLVLLTLSRNDRAAD